MEAVSSKPEAKPGYLPTLDGWRAVAILSVIFHHDALHSMGPFSTRWINEYGSVGVDVFFAISGILICSRLLEEEKICGRIQLKAFYIRRVFRILPPAVLYLLAIAVLAGFSLITVTYREWIGALAFCRNYPRILGLVSGDAGYYTAHFWSLALEEQFYFLLPTLLFVTPKKYRVPMFAALTILIASHRAVAINGRGWAQIKHHTEIRLDALLLPAMFAVLASIPRIRAYLKGWLRFWPLLVAGTICLLPYGVGSAWQTTIVVIVMPCIVLGSVLNPSNVFGRILELGPIRYVGRMSYSLYLWQELFINQHFGYGEKLGICQSWPLRLVLTFFCAFVSYRLVELPFIRLGHRLAPTPTPAHTGIGARTPGAVIAG